MAWYRTGTVTVTNGSPTVTGSGTAWIGPVKVGDAFVGPDQRNYEIASLVSGSAFTIVGGYLGATMTGADYSIVPTQSRLADLSGEVAALIKTFQSASDVAANINADIIPGWQDQVDNLIVDTQNTLTGSIAAQMPAYNLFPDSGRFTVLPAPDVYVGAFDPPDFFSPYNGATPWASVGKFIHNNTDNGGSGGSMTEPVTSLLAHGGASNDRYGIEFHVAEMTAGTGTVGSSVTEGGAAYNLMTTNGATTLPQAFSLSFYLRVVSGGAHINGLHELDGVPVNPGALPIGSWRRVRLEHTELDGFNSLYPILRAVPGSVVQMALPALVSGHFSRPDVGGISRILAAGALA